MVELIVSLAITAIIMVGMSAFFAGSFHNLFITQQKLSSTQGQFVLTEIIRDKFTDVKSAVETGTGDALLQNNITKDQLPFTYIKKDGDKLVFKDFFIFNGMYGDTPSADYTAVPNPAGITNIGTDYYITSPTENKIYKCSAPTVCPVFMANELNQPTGITTNGTDLFVADSGNDRVIKLTPPATTYIVLAENLNYPTGLALYSGNQLFISDTYKNRIIKIQTNFPPVTYPLSESELITVAGLGDDDSCTNTALYCKLNFPTGLAVDQTNNALYIADTGSNRILKISDPQPDLNAYEVKVDLGPTPTQISQINFSFPTATPPTPPFNIVETGVNTLHKGRYTTVGTTYAYSLSTTISNGDATKDCTPVTDPPHPFQACFERFTVADGNNLFVTDDPITLVPLDTLKPPADYTVTSTTATEVRVTPDNQVISYTPGDTARLNTSFSGEKIFTFDIDESNFTSGFHNVNIEVFEGTGASIKTASQTFAIGNNILGTAEDKIEVYPSAGLTYPTGLGFGATLSISASPISSPEEITSFDYTSDFNIDDLSFQKLGNVLETTITTPEQTYTLNAVLE